MRLLLYGAVLLLISSAASCASKLPAKSKPAAAEASSRWPAPLPSRPLSPKLNALRVRAMDDASSLRGLQWSGEAGLMPLTGWEYGARMQEISEALAGGDLREMNNLAVAGGMLPEGTDLKSLLASFTALSAGATYSPFDKKVLIVTQGSDVNGSVSEPLLVHEFVHALDDQHFDLLKLLLEQPYDFDRTEALFAVIEGDAVEVQRRRQYGERAWMRRSPDELAQVEDSHFDQYRNGIGLLFPPLLTEAYIFRYRDGLRFVETVRRKSGPEGVDELFRNPPRTSSEVLHPEKYNGAGPVAVELDEGLAARSGWREVTSSSIGEIGVRGVLMAAMSAREAVNVASGWWGDRAYLFEVPDARSRTVFVWKTQWQNAEQASRFFRSYGKVAGARAGALANSAHQTGADEVKSGDGARTTILRREGNCVMIFRGSDADASELASLVS